MVPELEYVVCGWWGYVGRTGFILSVTSAVGRGGGGRNPNSGKNDGLPVEEGPENRGGAETYICGHKFIGTHRETPRQGV